MNDTPAAASFPRDAPQSQTQRGQKPVKRRRLEVAAEGRRIADTVGEIYLEAACMTNSQRLATVRSHLRWWLAQNAVGQNAGATTESEAILSESILIVDGFYAGRTFEAASHRATWFMEPDELKIHDQNSSVAAVFQGDQITADHPVVQHEPVTVHEPVLLEDSVVLEDSVQDQVVVESDVSVSDEESRDVAPEQEDLPVSLPISAAKKPEKEAAAESEHDRDDDVRLPKAA